MGKYDGFLLITDFDGTIAVNGKVSEENQAAIREFQSEGGLYTIASGRQPMWLPKFDTYFKCNTYAVLMNGTILYDTKNQRDVSATALDTDVFDFIKNEVFKKCPEIPYARCHNYETFTDVYNGNDFPPEVRNQNIYKIIFRVPAELSDVYLKKIEELAEGRYYISRSWIRGIELQALGTSKGDSVRFFKKHYGDKIHTVVAAGDYENDIEMLKAADIAYAVGDAQESVKAVADRITVPCREHILPRILEDLIK